MTETCTVEPVVLRRQESPAYQTHALYEAVRSRSVPVVRALLQAPGVDINQLATSLGMTAFADACSRGDVEMMQLLLEHRCDPRIGCAGVAHPALFPAMAGDVEALKALMKARVVGKALEVPLLRTAAANGRVEALYYLQSHLIDSQPFLALTPGQQVVKLRREFKALDLDGNGFVDRGELGELLVKLGLGLTTEETEEAFLALDTAKDGRITLDLLSAYLLGDQGWRGALDEMAKAGGYAGEVGAKDAFTF